MALKGKTVAIFIDFTYEDLEVMYPKLRLEEEGATIKIIGVHPAGTKYTGKYGYPCPSDHSVGDVDVVAMDALVIPGGFAPDFMRRSKPMLDAIAGMLAAGKPVASICHGPWMFCSARMPDGAPVVKGKRFTCFHSIKDDVINAGGIFEDAPVVIDGSMITSRTPNDLTQFCQAIIAAMKQGC
mmetsp:Transcript_54268/g.121757  ORF Transcript_54268/g.121757 Transcript_54268/m.121757 type:complete len:183 (+) Transcript_54268:95-643(+)